MEKRVYVQFSLLNKVRWGPENNTWHHGPDSAVA